MHTPGIVTGMEVVAWALADNSVEAYPGMVVDPEGNVVLAGEPTRYYFDTRTAGMA
jgi:hypothetical protein